MNNARHMVEADLATLLEGDFASVNTKGVGMITLIDPDGLRHQGIKGRIDYDYVSMTSQGETIAVHEPVVVVRKSSLPRVPKPGERWFIQMPTGPQPTDPLYTFKLNTARPVDGGETIGFLKMYPKRADQE